MPNLNRRRFLQSASLLVGSAATRSLFGAGSRPTLAADAQPRLTPDSPPAPAFANQPVFEPTGLFLTWQRDPTTTMTVQWLGSEKDAAGRPI